MRFNCNLQNLSGCPHEQSGWCKHPARKTGLRYCKWYVESEGQIGEGTCGLAQ